MSQTADQLREFLDSEFGFLTYNSPVVLDSSYSLATRKWVTRELAAAVRASVSSAGLVYEKEQNDCEDFSLFEQWICLTAVVLAKQKHRASGLLTGLAIGFLGYRRYDGQGHCICFAVIREAGKLVAVFMEPQSSREITLTKNEKNNLLFCFM